MSDSPHEFIEKLKLENKALRRERDELVAKLNELSAAVIKLRDDVRVKRDVFYKNVTLD